MPSSNATFCALELGSKSGKATLLVGLMYKLRGSDTLKLAPESKYVSKPETWLDVVLNWKVSAAVGTVVRPPEQRPSMAAPSWQANSKELLSVELSEVILRLNGAL